MSDPTEYHAEMQRLRGELTALQGGGEGDGPSKPKRLSLSHIVELLLTRHGGERSAVSLTRLANGETAIDVKVRTGDDTDILTVEDAEHKAAEVYARLTELFPLASPTEAASVALTRNAKGETQIDVKAATGPAGPLTLDAAAALAAEVYDATRRRYPLADGRTARPGTVA